jgi:hypothetical protein
MRTPKDLFLIVRRILEQHGLDGRKAEEVSQEIVRAIRKMLAEGPFTSGNSITNPGDPTKVFASPATGTYDTSEIANIGCYMIYDNSHGVSQSTTETPVPDPKGGNWSIAVVPPAKRCLFVANYYDANNVLKETQDQFLLGS